MRNKLFNSIHTFSDLQIWLKLHNCKLTTEYKDHHWVATLNNSKKNEFIIGRGDNVLEAIESVVKSWKEHSK